MNRIEALRALGLDDESTVEDIKIAYKETVQILHPDRFASNKKLQERATEQFKNLQEAYEYLTSGKGSKVTGGSSSQTRASASHSYSPTNEIEARLAGIAAARTQLVAQRDATLDERRNGLIIGGLGAIVALLLRRIPPAIALGTTAIVWGIVQVVSAQATLNNLGEHIKELTREQKRLAEKLDEL